MNRSQFIAVIAALLLIIACLIPWVHIQDPPITMSGFDTGATRYGKPAYNHLIFALLLLACTFIPKTWAKRMALLFAALNLAWAIRNFAILPRCEAGECPQRLAGIFLLLAASIILMVVTLFPKEPVIGSKA